MSSDQDLQAAREMFWYYACSHFHMDRGGATDKYRRLGGSQEHERIWRAEYIAFWVSRIDPIDCTALHKLRHAHAYEAIPALLARANSGDDYSKFWLADTLMDLSRTLHAAQDDARAARERAIALWQEILSSPKGIISEHKRLIKRGDREALDAKSAEEYIRNYSVSQLKRFI